MGKGVAGALLGALILLVSPAGVLAGVAAPAPGSLDAGWRFLFQPARDQSYFPRIVRDRSGFQALWRELPDHATPCTSIPDDDARWRPVRLPHTWNARDTHDDHWEYARGTGCYRRELEVLPEWEDRSVGLHLLGAYARPRVSVDGRLLGEFHAGYTGLRTRLPREVVSRPGPHRLDVELHNRPAADVLPARYDPDFNLYGGLYREARLEVLAPIHLERGTTFVRPERVGAGWVVSIDLAVENTTDREEPLDLRARIVGDDGKPIAIGGAELVARGGDTSRTSLTLTPTASPSLWSPDAPRLYRLALELRRGGAVADRVEIPFGFRSFRFDPERGFVLNGERLVLRGANRHQDAPGLGNALPAALQEHDVRRLKDLGANFVRLAHYPQHPAFLDACDRLGLLVFAEIASWKVIGDERFFDAAERMMRAMIRRDRNHPSIVLWGMLNEGHSVPLFHRLRAIARTEDPTRPVSYAENKFEEGLEMGALDTADVIGVNYHTEYIPRYRASYPGGRFLHSEHSNSSRTQRGDWAKEIDQVIELDEDLDIIEPWEWFAGSALWSLRDYGTERPKKTWRTVHHSGLVDGHGFPKASHRYLRVRWAGDPRLSILTPPFLLGKLEKRPARPDEGPLGVFVASRCGAVTLEVEGSAFSRAGSTQRLFAFALEKAPDRVVARTICDGVEVRDVWSPAGAVARIRMESDLATLPADGSRIALVSLRMEDASGRLARHAFRAIELRVDGPARLRAPAHLDGAGRGERAVVEVRAGLGAVWLEGRAPGSVRVDASADGLETGPLLLEAR